MERGKGTKKTGRIEKASDSGNKCPVNIVMRKANIFCCKHFALLEYPFYPILILALLLRMCY
jgi:hypothetical protein